MSSNVGKMYLVVRIDASKHNLLGRRASELGLHLTKLAEEYVDRGLEQDAEESRGELSLDLRMFAAVRKSEQREMMRGRLRRLAWEYLQEDSEESHGVLVSFCEEAGVDTVEIVEETRKVGGAWLLASGGGERVSSATDWLIEMGRQNMEYPAETVFEAGSERGFSKFVLNQAKKKLGIMSKRVSRCWMWQWPAAAGEIH